jgi:transposase-like protein
MASWRDERSIAELWREHDISESLLRRWREQALEAGMERFAAGEQRSQGAVQRRRIARAGDRGKALAGLGGAPRGAVCSGGVRPRRRPSQRSWKRRAA